MEFLPPYDFSKCSPTIRAHPGGRRRNWTLKQVMRRRELAKLTVEGSLTLSLAEISSSTLASILTMWIGSRPEQDRRAFESSLHFLRELAGMIFRSRKRRKDEETA
jgi:hypothetical protein